MGNEIPKKKLSELSPAEKEALIAKPISQCSQIEKDLKLEILEERVKGIVVAKDLSSLGPDDLVTITVPVKTDGEMFEINLKKYYGRIQVTKRTAEQLMYMMSDHFARQRDLLKDRGNRNRGPQSSIIRGEESIQLERYQQIMEG